MPIDSVRPLIQIMYVTLTMAVFGTPFRQCSESVFLTQTFNTAHFTISHSLELKIRCNLLRGFLLHDCLPLNAYLVPPVSPLDVLPDAVNLSFDDPQKPYQWKGPNPLSRSANDLPTNWAIKYGKSSTTLSLVCIPLNSRLPINDRVYSQVFYYGQIGVDLATRTYCYLWATLRP